MVSNMQYMDLLLLQRQRQRQHLLHFKMKCMTKVSSLILILSLILYNKNRQHDSICILEYISTIRAFNIQHTSLSIFQRHHYQYDHHRQRHPLHFLSNDRQQQKRFVRQWTVTSSTIQLHMSLPNNSDDVDDPNHHNEGNDTSNSTASVTSTTNSGNTVIHEEANADTISSSSNISLEELYQQRLQQQIQILRQKDRSSHPISIQDLKIIYEDNDIIVVDKPAGILCLPSEDDVPSIVETVFQYVQQQQQITNTTTTTIVNNDYVQTMDQMVVHRLGYDTAGLVVLAKTISAVRALHALFRTRPSMMNHINDDLVIVPSSSSSSSSKTILAIDENPDSIPSIGDNSQVTQNHNDTIQITNRSVDHDIETSPTTTTTTITTTTTSLNVNNIHDYMNQMGIIRQYEVLVAGHVPNTAMSDTTTSPIAANNNNTNTTTTTLLGSGIINLPLMRCYESPPYMRVSTLEQQQYISKLDRTKIGTKKLFDTPKYSITYYEIISYEYYNHNVSLPVTRLTLTSITGRTHQLNVHCAAIGHPIVHDTVYGYNGTAVPYGGLLYNELPSDKASIELQDAIYQEATNATTSKMCVHATLIRFQHPITGINLEFISTPSF